MSFDILAISVAVVLVVVAVVRDQSVRQAWKQSLQDFFYARRLF